MTTKGGKLDTSMYASPWRELQPDGSLGQEYGPAPSTYARHLADHKLWSWKKPRSKESRRPDAERVLELLSSDAEIPAQEREVGRIVYVHGHSVRWAARHMGLSRSSVRTYLRRLRGRA